MSAPLYVQFEHELVFTVMISILGAAAMWPFKKAIKVYTVVTNKLEGIETELTLQRNNCLTTLQEQAKHQTDLLIKSVDTLEGIRVDLAEQTGYLKASVPVLGPNRRKSR